MGIADLKLKPFLDKWLATVRLHTILGTTDGETAVADSEAFGSDVGDEIEAHVGIDRSTVFRWIERAELLVQALGEAELEKLVTKKIANDKILLGKLADVFANGFARESAQEIVRIHETKGSQAAMKAFRRLLKAQLKAQARKALKAKLASLTIGKPVGHEVLPFRNVVLDGDALTELGRLPDNHVQCVGTSPPFYGLRSYGTPMWLDVTDAACKHEEKVAHGPHHPGQVAQTKSSRRVFERNREGAEHAQIITYSCTRCGAWLGELGQEPTVDLYIEHLVAIFRELRRVLRSDGLLWVEVGDTYSGSGRGPTGHNGIGDHERQGFESSGVTAPEMPRQEPLVGTPTARDCTSRETGWDRPV